MGHVQDFLSPDLKIISMEFVPNMIVLNKIETCTTCHVV
jgi:hypothetical protein